MDVGLVATLENAETDILAWTIDQTQLHIT